MFEQRKQNITEEKIYRDDFILKVVATGIILTLCIAGLKSMFESFDAWLSQFSTGFYVALGAMYLVGSNVIVWKLTSKYYINLANTIDTVREKTIEEIQGSQNVISKLTSNATAIGKAIYDAFSKGKKEGSEESGNAPPPSLEQFMMDRRKQRLSGGDGDDNGNDWLIDDDDDDQGHVEVDE